LPLDRHSPGREPPRVHLVAHWSSPRGRPRLRACGEPTAYRAPTGASGRTSSCTGRPGHDERDAMREIFEAELRQVGDDLAEMSRLVESAMSRAGQALLTADLQLAQQVIAADHSID